MGCAVGSFAPAGAANKPYVPGGAAMVGVDNGSPQVGMAGGVSL